MSSPTKEKLRQHYLHQRSQISHEDQQQAAERAADIFLKHITVQEKDVVAGYYPVRDELSVLPLLERLSCTITLPCIISDHQPLAFKTWHIHNLLKRHAKYPVLEPSAGEVITPTIIIVPLLAFDKQGHRLGYGGGFYDRTIEFLRKQHEHIQIVGYGYDSQCAKDLPVLLHDQKLSSAVTEKQFFVFKH